jgi:hypothetical protein
MAGSQYQLSMQAVVDVGSQWQVYDPQGTKIGDSTDTSLLENNLLTLKTTAAYTVVILRGTATGTTSFTLQSQSVVSLAAFLWERL